MSLTGGAADPEDAAADVSLRPPTLDEFVGQEVVRQQLTIVLKSAQARGKAPDHVLLAGPPGLGKTSLAFIVAAELGTPLRQTSGPALERPGDLVTLLTGLQAGEVLFIDEIHRLGRPVEEVLYTAMEDFRVDSVIGKGPGAMSVSLDVAPFTLVGATTRSGLLTGPLRDRFGFTGRMEFYESAELVRILQRSAGLLGVALHVDASWEIARRSRGTPRIANRLLRRCRDLAVVEGHPALDVPVVRRTLDIYEVDAEGLDRLDRAVLRTLLTTYGGGPVGVNALAVAVGEEPDTVEEVAEPFLLREGFLARTPRGRMATPKAWAHMNIAPPAGTPTLFG